MEMQMLGYLGKFMSCTVTVFILFRYFDTKYTRTYHSRLPYIALKALCLTANYMLYLIDSPAINVIFWLAVTCLVGGVFYYDDHWGKGKSFVVNIVFVFVFSICEAVGVILVSAGNDFLDIDPDRYIFSFVQTISGSATCLLLYYLVLKRIFIQKETERVLIVQYLIYIVASAYVLVNIGVILFLGTQETDSIAFRSMVVSAFFGICLNIYLFYLLDTFSENKELKYKIALYEKQEKINHEYYAKQADNYKTALAVIHDIRKHVKVLEELDQEGALRKVRDYANAFENMLSPLLMRPYCENAILNIIINDKMDFCMKNAIAFDVKVCDVDIDFMEQTDITTIFGNLLDNAVEACMGSGGGHITLEAGSFNGLIYVQIANSFSGEIRQDHRGFPLSGRGEQHGIGLRNVEKALEKYSGSMEFSAENDKFTVTILFSGRPDLSNR